MELQRLQNMHVSKLADHDTSAVPDFSDTQRRECFCTDTDSAGGERSLPKLTQATVIRFFLERLAGRLRISARLQVEDHVDTSLAPEWRKTV